MTYEYLDLFDEAALMVNPYLGQAETLSKPHFGQWWRSESLRPFHQIVNVLPLMKIKDSDTLDA